MDEKSQHKTKNEKSIELRSEKVRNIIGQVPPVLLRYGIVIIGFVIVALIGVSAFLPYKEKIHVELTIHALPKTGLIKSTKSGTMLMDTTIKVVEKGQILGYVQSKDSLEPVQSSLSGRLIPNVSNNDIVETGSVLFAVIPSDLLSTYGEAEIDDGLLPKLKPSCKVVVHSSKGEEYSGKISNIYSIQTINRKHKLRIDFDTINSREIFDTKLEGTIILSESTILKRFIQSIGNGKTF